METDLGVKTPNGEFTGLGRFDPFTLDPNCVLWKSRSTDLTADLQAVEANATGLDPMDEADNS